MRESSEALGYLTLPALWSSACLSVDDVMALAHDRWGLGGRPCADRAKGSLEWRVMRPLAAHYADTALSVVSRRCLLVGIAGIAIRGGGFNILHRLHANVLDSIYQRTSTLTGNWSC